MRLSLLNNQFDYIALWLSFNRTKVMAFCTFDVQFKQKLFQYRQPHLIIEPDYSRNLLKIRFPECNK